MPTAVIIVIIIIIITIAGAGFYYIYNKSQNETILDHIKKHYGPGNYDREVTINGTLQPVCTKSYYMPEGLIYIKDNMIRIGLLHGEIISIGDTEIRVILPFAGNSRFFLKDNQLFLETNKKTKEIKKISKCD